MSVFEDVSKRYRHRRWEMFNRVFPEIETMRVLDLGGTPAYWRTAPRSPAHVTVVNLITYSEAPEFVATVAGDACDLPQEIASQQFDLVVSNSLIEHVGGHAKRQRLADAIHSLSDRHWVQTPYRYFPIEPHWFFPGLQFLPFAARVTVTKWWPLGHRWTSDDDAAVASVHEVDLIGLRQMRSYFPDSTMWLERAAGLPKSMVAIRA